MTIPPRILQESLDTHKVMNSDEMLDSNPSQKYGVIYQKEVMTFTSRNSFSLTGKIIKWNA